MEENNKDYIEIFDETKHQRKEIFWKYKYNWSWWWSFSTWLHLMVSQKWLLFILYSLCLFVPFLWIFIKIWFMVWWGLEWKNWIREDNTLSEQEKEWAIIIMERIWMAFFIITMLIVFFVIFFFFFGAFLLPNLLQNLQLDIIPDLNNINKI